MGKNFFFDSDLRFLVSQSITFIAMFVRAISVKNFFKGLFLKRLGGIYFKDDDVTSNLLLSCPNLFFLQYYDHDFDKLWLGYFLVNFYRINTYIYYRRMYSLEFLWWIYVMWRNWLYNLCKKEMRQTQTKSFHDRLLYIPFRYYCFKGRIHLLHFRIWKGFCKIHTYGSRSMAGEFGPHRYLHYSISKLFSEHI